MNYKTHFQPKEHELLQSHIQRKIVIFWKLWMNTRLYKILKSKVRLQVP